MIHCKYDALVDPKSLKFHPKNRNKHPKDQIDRLAKIIEYQGWRYAIKVSNLSGFVTSGHGRIAAAISKKWTKVPVVYQDYSDEDQEYADVQADNAIASWADLDLAGINSDIPDFDPSFDLDLLGIKNFELDPSEKFQADIHNHQNQGLQGFVLEVLFPNKKEMLRIKESLQAEGFIVKEKNG